MTGTDDTQRMILRETLRLAVPMHMHELRRLPVDSILEIASDTATDIGTHGDDLQFGGKHCAQAFNALARGLAAASLIAQGGVTFQGLHWCVIAHCDTPEADHPQPYPWSAPVKPKPRPIVDVLLPEVPPKGLVYDSGAPRAPLDSDRERG